MVLLFLAAGCGGRTSALEANGPQAMHLEHLWWMMLWITGVVFVLVMAWLAAALWRRGERSGEKVRGGEGEGRMVPWMMGLLAVTAAVLFGLLIASVLADRDLDALETANALTITVTGHQWWWSVRYENSDPSRVVETANEIHVPVGKPVHLQLRSADVIHSLWVPRLHGKKDLIPGRDTSLWIQANEAGEYRGVCAEFCGHQHAHMQLLVVAQPEVEFEAWLANERTPAKEPETEKAKRGREVFLGTTCVMCHSVRGTPAGSRAGPELTHFGSRRTLGAGVRENSRGHLAAWIRDPQEVKPGVRMPPHGFSEEDLEALAEYLGGLK